MEKYESICVVGEGSYGIVMKCRHKETSQVVAIKKFIETEDDHNVRKMALREIRMLKKLHHDNLVNMIEVFRRKRRFYLVFEYMEHTVLDELEEHPKGLGEEVTRQHMFQVVRGIDFCHKNNIVHRDVKPENILVSNQGVVKLCDFGFARTLSPGGGETYTDYVATRWYRAPELLVGDTRYGRPVDVWAIGCLLAEMLSGDPLFPGESDIDQIYQIMKLLGSLCSRHLLLIAKNPLLKDLRKKSSECVDEITNPSRCLYKLFPSWPHLTLDFVSLCLRLDPSLRPESYQLLEHSYFTCDKFREHFLPELKNKIEQEFIRNPLLNKIYLQMMDSSVEKRGVSIRHISQSDGFHWRLNYPDSVKASEKQRPLMEDEELTQSKTVTRGYEPPLKVAENYDFENNINENIDYFNKYSPLMESLKLPNTSGTSMPSSNNSPQNLHGLLHPSVNNLTFSHSLRNDSKQIAAVTKGVPRTQVLRKLEHRVTFDMVAKPAWKNKDDFTLPNLPGASLSPHKHSKKQQNLLTSSHNTVDAFISPTLQSRSPSVSPQSKVVSYYPFIREL